MRAASRLYQLGALLLAAGLLLGTAVPVQAAIQWEGQEWGIKGAAGPSADISHVGDGLHVKLNSNGVFTLHVNRVLLGGGTDLSQSSSPFISFSFTVNSADPNTNVYMQTSNELGVPGFNNILHQVAYRLTAGSTQVDALDLFRVNGSPTLHIKSFGNASASDADGSTHTLWLGKTSDGLIQAGLDGNIFSSTWVRDETGSPNSYFGDVYLNITGAAGTEITFTDFSYGTDFAAVPEPSTAVMCLSGMVLFGAARWRRRRQA